MQQQNIKKLLEPHEVKSLIGSDDIIMVHLSSSNSYTKLHIPSAVNIPAHKICSSNSSILGNLPTIESLTKLFIELNYNENKHFIVYDDEGGGWAGRFLWILDSINHKKYSYLNGGLISWVKEGHPIEDKLYSQQSAREIPHIKYNANYSASFEYIKENLNNENIVFWDARSRDEYNGTKKFAKHGGHIPNAIHFEWMNCLDFDNNCRIKKNIIQELHNIGITTDKEIITYCQNHHRSGVTYMAARLNGFPVIKAYPGSWAEWGNSTQ